MTEISEHQNTVVRTSRGLSIAGTRITLYNIMDYLHAGWPAQRIRDRLHLTDKQITEVMDYIEDHHSEMETEYQSVLQEAKENRSYWETRNQKRFAEIADRPPQPGQEEIRAKLQNWKAKIERT